MKLTMAAARGGARDVSYWISYDIVRDWSLKNWVVHLLVVEEEVEEIIN